MAAAVVAEPPLWLAVAGVLFVLGVLLLVVVNLKRRQLGDPRKMRGRSRFELRRIVLTRGGFGDGDHAPNLSEAAAAQAELDRLDDRRSRKVSRVAVSSLLVAVLALAISVATQWQKLMDAVAAVTTRYWPT